MKKLELTLNKIPKINEPIALCLGNFDGVHLGHQRLIKEAVLQDENKVAVLTFCNPLGQIFSLRKSTSLLTSVDDRLEILKGLGVSYLIAMEFTKEIRDLRAIEFIDLVLKKLNVQRIYVGNDYRFGKNIEGDVQFLQKHFPVTILNLMKNEEDKISTSSIIRLIQNGDIKRANLLLGRPYRIKGQVVKGIKDGQKIGFPTANLKLEVPYVLPLNGVYKTNAYFNNKKYKSITNVGIHPTLNKLSSPIIEVHILDFHKNIYNEELRVEFLEFLREEKIFNTIKELKEQIKTDLKNIK